MMTFKQNFHITFKATIVQTAEIRIKFCWIKSARWWRLEPRYSKHNRSHQNSNDINGSIFDSSDETTLG